jgi:hypothetical protein
VTILSGYGAQYLIVELRHATPARSEARRLLAKTAVASATLLLIAAAYLVARDPLCALYRKVENASTAFHTAGYFGDLHLRTGIELMRFGALLVAGALLQILLRYRPRAVRSRLWPYVLAGVVCLELVSGSVVSVQTAPADEVFRPNELIRFLEHNGKEYRVLNMGGRRTLCQTLAARYGIQLADGYDPMILDDYQRFTNASLDIVGTVASTRIRLIDSRIDDVVHWTPIDLLGVKYILSPVASEKPGKLQLVAEFHEVRMYSHNRGTITVPDVFVYENPDAFPRVYITSQTETVPPEDSLAALIDLVPGEGAIVEHDPPFALDAGISTAEITSTSPNRIEIQAKLEGNGLLCMSEIWHHGWRAIVDGKEQEVARVNNLLRGIYLRPGTHTVEMVFLPGTYSRGRYVSLVTMICVFTTVVVRPVVRKKRVENTASDR